MLSNSLIELDRAHLVHPVASYRGHEKLGVRVLTSASGATVTDATGRQLIDGFAGLWCVNAGYGHESIVEAAARQMRELPYATAYFGLGSEPAIRLGRRTCRTRAGRPQPRLFHARRIGCRRQHGPLHPLLLACHAASRGGTSSSRSSRAITAPRRSARA